MKSVLCRRMCAVAICVATLGAATGNAEDILSVKATTFAGECVGDCYTGLVITKSGVDFVKRPWAPKSKKEIKVRHAGISAQEWAELTAAISTRAFFSLPETIGCPDCWDQGGETVEVTTATRHKTVAIEYGANIAKMEKLLKFVRALRQRMEESSPRAHAK